MVSFGHILELNTSFRLVSVLTMFLLFLPICSCGEFIVGAYEQKDNLDVIINRDARISTTLISFPHSIGVSGYVLSGDGVSIFLLNESDSIKILDSKDLVEVKPKLDAEISAIIDLINSSSYEPTANITTNLVYAPNSSWDIDDDGIEFYYNAIDFSVGDSEFDFEVNEEKLCTVWQIYSVYSGNLTTTCVGANSCCQLYGLSSQADSGWDKNLFLTYGKYSSSEKNIIGAKVVYANIQLRGDSPTYEIFRGEWMFLPAYFYDPKFEFNNVCGDACIVGGQKKDLKLMVEVTEPAVLYLESINYIGSGLGSLEYPLRNISTLKVNQRSDDGRPIGYYEVQNINSTINLFSTTRPKESLIKANITFLRDLHFGGVSPTNPTEYETDDALPQFYSSFYLKNIHEGNGSFDIVYSESNLDTVSTETVYLSDSMSFSNANFSLKKINDVLMVSKCIEFSDLECLVWEPFTSDFRDIESHILFSSDSSGLYGGVNTSVLEYFVQFSSIAIQLDDAKVGQNIKWETLVSTRYDEQISFEVLVTLPKYALHVTMFDSESGDEIKLDDISEEGDDLKSFKVVLKGGRNFTINYFTEGPAVSENIVLENSDSLVKEIVLSSPMQYSNISVFTNIGKYPADRISIYGLVDGAYAELAGFADYQVFYDDIDSDGLIDWIYWNVPKTFNDTFIVYVDKRIEHLASAGIFSKGFVNADGKMSVEIKNHAVNRFVDDVLTPYHLMFVSADDDDYDFESSSTDYEFKLKSELDTPMKFNFPNNSFTVDFVNKVSTKVLVSGDNAWISDIYNFTDLKLRLDNSVLHLDFLLNSNSSPIHYLMNLNPNQAVMVLDEEEVLIRDRAGNLLGKFVKPSVADADGRKIGFKVNLEQKQRYYVLTLSLEANDLKNAVYPVNLNYIFKTADEKYYFEGYVSEFGIEHNENILVGKSSLEVFRGFLDFNISSIPDDALVSSTKLRLYLNEAYPENCSDCLCEIRGRDISDGSKLFAASKNGTVYSSKKCISEGIMEFDLGAFGRMDFMNHLSEDIFRVSISSNAEDENLISFYSSKAGNAFKPKLYVEWTNVSYEVESSLVIDSLSDIFESINCRYNRTGNNYVCIASEINITGDVDLLHDGEDKATSILFFADESFNIFDGGALAACGRTYEEIDSNTEKNLDGGDIIVYAKNIFVFGEIISCGGNISSNEFPMDAGDGGNILLNSENEAIIYGDVKTLGGNIGLNYLDGKSGGAGGNISIVSGSSMFAFGLSANSGVSNFGDSMGGGIITLDSKNNVICGNISSDGGLSQFGDGGNGGEIRINSDGSITMYSLSAVGGVGKLGFGGLGGMLTAFSKTSDITVSDKLEVYSGESDRTENRAGGKITLATSYGKIRVDDEIDAYGGVEIDDGVGGAGGNINIYSLDVELNSKLNVYGGKADKGFGGKGGAINIQYCFELNESGFDVSGGVGLLDNGTVGEIRIEHGKWCGGDIFPEIIDLPEKTMQNLLDDGFSITDLLGNILSKHHAQGFVRVKGEGNKPLIEFSMGSSVNLSNIFVAAKDSRIAVDFSNEEDISKTHTIYIPNNLNRGCYICPYAKVLEEVGYGCRDMIVFTHDYCKDETEIEGITCHIDGSSYKITGLTGTGGGELPFEPYGASETGEWLMYQNISYSNLSIYGEDGGDRFGNFGCFGGDINGDGIDDLIFSAYGGGIDSGQAYVMYGGEGIWSMNMNASDLNGSFFGENTYDFLGHSVASGGDMNGDGLADFVLGAYGSGYGSSGYAGQIYLFYGGTEWGMRTNVSSANASFYGENSNDQAGYSVDFIGDFNGDGFDDLAIGANYNEYGGGKGQVYIIFGGSEWNLRTNLSSANVSFFAEDNSQAGFSISYAGDVNVDGFDDLIIGAPNGIGKTYLIYGGTEWGFRTNLSDVNASFYSEKSGDASGVSVGYAGDINLDGYDDFLIGAHNNQFGGGVGTGQAYLVYGGSEWSMNTNLSKTNASFYGEDGGDSAGISVGFAGDVNGDGLDDMLVGAYGNEYMGGSNAGQAYLIFGGSDWGFRTNLSRVNASFYGEGISNYAGAMVGFGGDFNNDGQDDFIVGAYGNSEGGGSNSGKSYVFYGDNISYIAKSINSITVSNVSDYIGSGGSLVVEDVNSPIFINITASGGDPTKKDVIVCIVNSSNAPYPIKVKAIETGVDTNEYHGVFRVRTAASNKLTKKVSISNASTIYVSTRDDTSQVASAIIFYGDGGINSAPTFGFRSYQNIEMYAKDATIESSDGLHGYDRNLQVGRYGGIIHRSLLQFNLTDIPDNANVTRSVMYLYLYNSTYSPKDTAYNITNLWDETFVSWTQRTSGAAWDTAGGDYE